MLAPDWTSEIAKALGAVGVPMYLSGMARGLLGLSHRLQFRHHRREALQEADLVILAGVSCDFRLEYGNHISAKATLIMVNRDERELNKNRKAETAIHADPGEFIIRLASHLNTVPERSTWFTMLREREHARDQRIEQQAMVASQGINPVALFRTLDALLPEGAVIVADGGDFVGTASYTLRPRTPLCWLDPGVFGTLGVGGGFALGAKAVRPEAEVYIIYGDGSSAYSLMEVDSMVRNGLAAIAIIGNDASWGQIARDQVEILKDDCGTRLARSDYHKVAEAFGGKGWRVETLEQFETAVKQAQEVVRSGVPCVINAILAKSEFRKGSLSM
jgi:acetolactate synthase-1/2/3 large subunit